MPGSRSFGGDPQRRRWVRSHLDVARQLVEGLEAPHLWWAELDLLAPAPADLFGRVRVDQGRRPPPHPEPACPSSPAGSRTEGELATDPTHLGRRHDLRLRRSEPPCQVEPVERAHSRESSTRRSTNGQRMVNVTRSGAIAAIAAIAAFGGDQATVGTGHEVAPRRRPRSAITSSTIEIAARAGWNGSNQRRAPTDPSATTTILLQTGQPTTKTEQPAEAAGAGGAIEIGRHHGDPDVGRREQPTEQGRRDEHRVGPPGDGHRSAEDGVRDHVGREPDEQRDHHRGDRRRRPSPSRPAAQLVDDHTGDATRTDQRARSRSRTQTARQARDRVVDHGELVVDERAAGTIRAGPSARAPCVARPPASPPRAWSAGRRALRHDGPRVLQRAPPGVCRSRSLFIATSTGSRSAHWENARMLDIMWPTTSETGAATTFDSTVTNSRHTSIVLRRRRGSASRGPRRTSSQSNHSTVRGPRLRVEVPQQRLRTHLHLGADLLEHPWRKRPHRRTVVATPR